MKRIAVTAMIASLMTPVAAQAGCGITDAGRVSTISNFFPSLELLAKKMKDCATDKLVIETKLTTEHKTETPLAFAAARSPYDAAGVANGSITMLQAKGELLPLNALVAKYRDKYAIEDQMLIKFGDEIAAIAFQVNAQHLYYRQDLFDKYHLAVPTTYEELIKAAEVLKQETSIDAPLGAAYKNGWELGNEFVDIYLAMGGSLVDLSTGQAAFNTAKGVAALDLMKRLKGYMSPNVLAIDFGGVKQQMQQGRIAMAFLWGDLASSMDNPKESVVAGKVGFAPAPSIVPGGPGASAFWWDGFVIPKNLPDDPDLTFRVLMEAMKPEVVAENNGLTLWARSNYQPTKYAKAVIDTVKTNVPAYPMTPQEGLAHEAIGDHIADALVGKRTSQQALDDAATSYRQAAMAAKLMK